MDVQVMLSEWEDWSSGERFDFVGDGEAFRQWFDKGQRIYDRRNRAWCWFGGNRRAWGQVLMEVNGRVEILSRQRAQLQIDEEVDI